MPRQLLYLSAVSVVVKEHSNVELVEVCAFKLGQTIYTVDLELQSAVLSNHLLVALILQTQDSHL